jgi:hypothetical protein
MTPLLPSVWVSMFDRGAEKCYSDVFRIVMYYLFFDVNFLYNGLVKILTSVPGVITQWKRILLHCYVIHEKAIHKKIPFQKSRPSDLLMGFDKTFYTLKIN